MDTEAVKLRESFLRELMILQSESSSPSPQASSSSLLLSQQQHQQKHQKNSINQSNVQVTLFDDNGSFGRTLNATSVACDTGLTHILLSKLETPIGSQSNVLQQRFSLLLPLRHSIASSTLIRQKFYNNLIRLIPGTTSASHHMDNKFNSTITTPTSATTQLTTPASTKLLQRQQYKPAIEPCSFIQTSSATSSSLTSANDTQEKPFFPRKALVLKKFSRLEYERLCNPNLSEESLAQKLSQRGSAYESLKHYDQIQRSCLKQIESVLAANDIDYQTVDRFGYTDEKVEWADVIVTSGGDGTFLMAASKVSNRNKPVIGINSDPTKSVGHLCLPSQYTNNFDRVIDSLKSGKYQWYFRQRLRVTLTGDAALETPRALDDIRYNIRGQFHDQEDSHEHHGASPIVSCEASHSALGLTTNTTTTSATPIPTMQTFEGTSQRVKQLKERVLNDVFVGELLSARVSYYELSVNNNKPLKFKSSGLTVCTGTGSTSWYFNINKMTEQQVQAISGIINSVAKSAKINTSDASLIADITKQFNETLKFPPTERIMAYSIRDPIGYAPSNTGYSHRGQAYRIEIKSRMQNAYLVLDGCQFYPFNNGSFTLIEMHDEDALKTLNLQETL